MLNRVYFIFLLSMFLVTACENLIEGPEDEIKYSFTMGTYVQYYFSRSWSVLFEWNPTVTGWRDSFNSVSMGIELGTGGHFFKVFGSNNALINLSQFLAGADKKFSDGDARIGFMITRLL